MEETHEERRHYRRLKKSVDLTYMLPLTFIGEKWKSKTVDIGGGGVCLQCDRFLKKDSVIALQLELKLANGKKEILRTLGQVVWHKREDATGKYLMGIKFILHDEVGKKINHFVEEKGVEI